MTNIRKLYSVFKGENPRSPELLRDGQTSPKSLNVQQNKNLGLEKRRGIQSVLEVPSLDIQELKYREEGGKEITEVVAIEKSLVVPSEFTNREIKTGETKPLPDGDLLITSGSPFKYGFVKKDNTTYFVLTQTGDEFVIKAEIPAAATVQDVLFNFGDNAGAFSEGVALSGQGPHYEAFNLPLNKKFVDVFKQDSVFPIKMASSLDNIDTVTSLVPDQLNSRLKDAVLDIVTNTYRLTLKFKNERFVSADVIPENTFALADKFKDKSNYLPITTTKFDDALYINSPYDGLFKYKEGNLARVGFPKNLEGVLSTPFAFSGLNTKSNPSGPSQNILFEVYIKGTNFYRQRVHSFTLDANKYTETFSSAAGPSAMRVTGTIDVTKWKAAHLTPLGKVSLEVVTTDPTGTVFYLRNDVDSIVNATTGAFSIQVYRPGIKQEYNTPVLPIEPPPLAAVVTSFENKIILGGTPSPILKDDGTLETLKDAGYGRLGATEVAYMDIEEIDSFNISTRFNAEENDTSPVTGVIGIDDTLLIFKEEAIYRVTGNLDGLQFRVDKLNTEGVGCVSQNSLVIDTKGMVYFTSLQSIYAMDPNGLPEEVLFSHAELFNGFPFDKRKCRSMLWASERLLLFWLPVTDTDGTVNPNTSKLITINLDSTAKFTWSNIDFSGGYFIKDGNLWGSDGNKMFRFRERGDSLAYYDENMPIEFIYRTAWDSLDDPSIRKRFNKLKIRSIGSAESGYTHDPFGLTVDMYANYNNNPIASVTKSVGSTGNWGNFLWGLAPWGGKAQKEMMFTMFRQAVYSMMLEFTNKEGGENVLISGYELEISAPYDTRLQTNRKSP